jgi:hypothetical protein
MVLLLVIAGFGSFSSLEAADLGDFPLLSMPVEYVNYTIVNVDGVLWAKIDGTYPIHILNFQNGFSQMPMVYPTPPQTTNISLAVNGNRLSWSNYSDGGLHHTAIGDWKMIYSVVGPVSDFFVLTIHYEHPVQLVNGSFMFLYDLNISPYLTSESNHSTVYYTIIFDSNATNIKAYTAQTDTKWNPINFNITENGATKTVSIIQNSEYGNVLGDLIVKFSEANAVSEFPVWMMPALTAAFLFAALIYAKSKRSNAKN